MKNKFQKLTCLIIPFLLVACGASGAELSSSSSKTSRSSSQKSSSDRTSSERSTFNWSSSREPSSSSQKSSSTVAPHEHVWSSEWTYDDNNHWHACTVEGCNQKSDSAAHTYGEWQEVNLGTFLNDTQYQHSNVKMKTCSACGQFKLDDVNVLPEVRFVSDVPEEIEFATIAKSTDTDRPEVDGRLTITNVADSFKKTDVACTMKVRGNQTAGFPKKGFRIKLGGAMNLLGLNGGQKYKKWVLLADAKDSCIVRTAMGLSVSKAICVEDNVWVSDFTPVSVYLNDTYWGFYLLAEQKEAKEGRINVPVPAKNYTGIDIGYNFELDHYAEDEPKKADGGDPTFTLDYGNKFTRNSYSIENSLANFGPTTSYTINSDITDGPANTAINPNNSNQVKFIRDRMQALFEVLYQAAVNKKPYTIGNDDTDTAHYNKAYAASGKSIRECIEDNFDLDTWACGFIINAFSCPPDVGYSSFYMSFDNSATGAKKLRYDNPWDFDSNFGNRNNFITTADTSSGGKDPYYMDRTSNMWLQYLSKLDFFMNVVKEKWNKARENQAFENMFKLMRNYFKFYDYEARKNFQKWPEIKASDDNVGSYFGGELRDIFKKPSDRLKAQVETINWCAKRVNYLEKKFGGTRPDVDTGA